MDRRRHTGRRLATVALALPLAFAFGGTAFAGPGGSHGNSASAPGQLKKQTAAPTSSPAVAASPGNSNHSQGTAGTSGTVSQPQPYSNADQNNTGANDTSSTNQYRSTRNGSPSLNGNGNGQATGKPCAGCVGKADNKNPQGQYPNGTDHNKGYECDKNNGIGKSNPAHTGCQAATTPPPPACTTTGTCPPTTCEAAGNCPPPGCKATGTCPPGNCATEGTCPPPNCEQTNTCKCPTDDTACAPQPPKHHQVVPPVHSLKPPAAPKPPVSVLALRPAPQLPFTGSTGVLQKLLLALAAICTGMVLIMAGRAKVQPRRVPAYAMARA